MLIAFEWKIKIKSLYFIWKVDFLRTPNCNVNWTNSLQKSAFNINCAEKKNYYSICSVSAKCGAPREQVNFTLFKWYGYKCILISDRFNLHFSNILTWPTSKSVDSLNEIPIYTQKRQQMMIFIPIFFSAEIKIKCLFGLQTLPIFKSNPFLKRCWLTFNTRLSFIDPFSVIQIFILVIFFADAFICCNREFKALQNLCFFLSSIKLSIKNAMKSWGKTDRIPSKKKGIRRKNEAFSNEF